MGNPDSQDWVRLEVLILRRATTILRKLFRRRWKQTQSSDWQNNSSFGSAFISSLGLPVYQSCGRLHKMTLEEGDVDNWDFSILSRILHQVDFKPDNLNNSLKTQYESENLLIANLISTRKKAMEYPKKSMADQEFLRYWDEIEKILVSLGENESDLERLKRAKSVSEDDLRTLSEVESHPIDQLSLSEAKRLKEQAKIILSTGGNIENALNCLTSALGLHNLSDSELGALYASRSEAYLKKAESISPTKAPEERKQLAYLALKDAKHALYLRPAWGLAHYRVGSTYVELGKHKKAAKYLDQALDLEPNIDEIKVANNSCKIKLVQLEDNFAPGHKTFQSLHNPYHHPGGTRLSPEVKSQIELILFQDKSEDNNILGDIYKAHKLRDGLETPQNYKRAAALYRKSAKARNPEGMYNLALLKLEGQGLDQDVKGAISLLKKAAKFPNKLCSGNGLNFSSNVGVSESAFLLGFLASEGIGFPPQRDLFSASVWYSEASEHGSGAGSYNLGLLYHLGLGVNRDTKRSLQLWKLSASRKAPEAMVALAIHHAKEWESIDARRWLDLAINEWRTSTCNYTEHGVMDEFIWTPTEIQEFSKVLSTIESWRRCYGLREICRWESQAGYSPGRTMNQNLHMKVRLARMLRGMDQEKQKIEETQHYLESLTPKPIIISLPNAKEYVLNLRRQIRSQSVSLGDGLVEITDITDVDQNDRKSINDEDKDKDDSGRVSKASVSTNASDSTFITTSSSDESDSCAFIELQS